MRYMTKTIVRSLVQSGLPRRPNWENERIASTSATWSGPVRMLRAAALHGQGKKQAGAKVFRAIIDSGKAKHPRGLEANFRGFQAQFARMSPTAR